MGRRPASGRQFQGRAASPWSPSGHWTHESEDPKKERVEDAGRGYGDTGYRGCASAQVFRSISKETREPRQRHDALSLICFCHIARSARFFVLEEGAFEKDGRVVCRPLGVEFVSLSKGVATSTATGKMVFTVFGAAAVRVAYRNRLKQKIELSTVVRNYGNVFL